ncbi:MAG: hypothetical protein J6T38_11025 [Bacteroidaceae bacterium]|nr:hypothetical protein [Bacteroidaceae bacterium]
MLAHELIESVGRRLLLRIEVHAAIGIRHALHAIDELVALRIEGRDAFRLFGLQLLGIDIVERAVTGSAAHQLAGQLGRRWILLGEKLIELVECVLDHADANGVGRASQVQFLH